MCVCVRPDLPLVPYKKFANLRCGRWYARALVRNCCCAYIYIYVSMHAWQFCIPGAVFRSWVAELGLSSPFCFWNMQLEDVWSTHSAVKHDSFTPSPHPVYGLTCKDGLPGLIASGYRMSLDASGLDAMQTVVIAAASASLRRVVYGMTEKQDRVRVEQVVQLFVAPARD